MQSQITNIQDRYQSIKWLADLDNLLLGDYYFLDLTRQERATLYRHLQGARSVIVKHHAQAMKQDKESATL